MLVKDLLHNITMQWGLLYDHLVYIYLQFSFIIQPKLSSLYKGSDINELT